MKYYIRLGRFFVGFNSCSSLIAGALFMLIGVPVLFVYCVDHSLGISRGAAEHRRQAVEQKDAKACPSAADAQTHYLIYLGAVEALDECRRQGLSRGLSIMESCPDLFVRLSLPNREPESLERAEEALYAALEQRRQEWQEAWSRCETLGLIEVRELDAYPTRLPEALDGERELELGGARLSVKLGIEVYKDKTHRSRVLRRAEAAHERRQRRAASRP